MPLAEALKKAHDEELDLVEIAPNAQPPVAKIVDFKKFKYLEEKKEKEARRNARQTELKEVRFSPFIGDHDYNTAIGKVKKFLSEGDLVKISVIFKGRQMAHTEFGPKLLERIMVSLDDIGEKDRPERFEGRRFVTIVKPIKKPETLRLNSGQARNPSVKLRVNKQLETRDKKQETNENQNQKSGA